MKEPRPCIMICFRALRGLGERRKETLRKHYPTIDALKQASLEELKQLLPDDVATSLFETIKSLSK
jgi:excinuclease ABC subunit C